MPLRMAYDLISLNVPIKTFGPFLILPSVTFRYIGNTL